MSQPRHEPSVAEPVKLTTREAVVRAISEGLTSKEAAFRYGKTMQALYGCANRLGISFPSSGMGRPPKYPKGGGDPYRIDATKPEEVALARVVRLSESVLAKKGIRTDIREALDEVRRVAQSEIFRRMQSR